MLIKDWVEAVTIQSSKDQHRHTLAFRLNNAFQSLARDHLWSWLDSKFYFTTVPTFEAEAVAVLPLFDGVAGENWITSVGALQSFSNFDRDATGAEILITPGDHTTSDGPSMPLHLKIRRVGESNLVNYTVLGNNVYLDQELSESFTAAKVTVFRREYLPKAPQAQSTLMLGTHQGWTADRLIGKISFRDMVSALRSTTRPTLQYLTRGDYQHNYGHAVESGSQVPQYYQMASSSRVPTPEFEPIVTGRGAFSSTDLGGVGGGQNGTYYLACAYIDSSSGIMSPLGPISTHEATLGAAAIGGLEVEYNRGTALDGFGGVPEESYELLLFMSKPNPVGLDGKEISSTNLGRQNERMIPFHLVGVHPRVVDPGAPGTLAGGIFVAPDEGAFRVPFDQSVGHRPRYYPQADSQSVFLREMPNAAIPFSVDGKLKLPWFCDLQDSPPIPDNFQDIVNTIVSIGINESAGGADVQKRGQYEFMLRKLRGRDLKRSRTGDVDPRHRGDVIPRVDRYGLLD